MCDLGIGIETVELFRPYLVHTARPYKGLPELNQLEVYTSLVKMFGDLQFLDCFFFLRKRLSGLFSARSFRLGLPSIRALN